MVGEVDWGIGMRVGNMPAHTVRDFSLAHPKTKSPRLTKAVSRSLASEGDANAFTEFEIDSRVALRLKEAQCSSSSDLRAVSAIYQACLSISPTSGVVTGKIILSDGRPS